MKGLERLNVVEQRIFINNREIHFKGKIEALAISPDKIFVVIDMPSKAKVEEQNNFIKKYNLNIVPQAYSDSDIFNNTYCYDYEGNLLWQIKPPYFKDFPKFGQYPIVGVDYDEKKNKFYATDFMGRRFDVNLETGELMSFTTTK